MHESSEKKSAQTAKQSIFNSLNFLDQNNLDFKEKFDVLFHTIPDGVVLIRDGKIIYSFLDADYRNRAEPEDVLNSLKLSENLEQLIIVD